jgi:hypothetical protein
VVVGDVFERDRSLPDGAWTNWHHNVGVFASTPLRRGILSDISIADDGICSAIPGFVPTIILVKMHLTEKRQYQYAPALVRLLSLVISNTTRFERC